MEGTQPQQVGAAAGPPAGTLSWRLSSHPYTLLCFLFFRISSLLIYLFGMWFVDNYVLIFIITMLFLSADFYNLKNIAGRRLVGLRWWNEVNNSGATTMVFESLDPNDPAGRKINATDKRFFWLALYIQPVLWIVMAILSLVKGQFIWLTLVVIALVLTITNTVAFSRCDKFSQASNMASSAFYNSNLASNFASSMVSSMFGGNR